MESTGYVIISITCMNINLITWPKKNKNERACNFEPKP